MCHQGLAVTLVALQAVKTANFIFTKNQSEKNSSNTGRWQPMDSVSPSANIFVGQK